MTARERAAVIIDTSVVVAGLLTAAPRAPTARILDGMLWARFPFLLSVDLLAEYRRVLLRPRISERHGLSEAEIDVILLRIAENAMVSDPGRSTSVPPDPGDQLLWDIMAAHPGSVLVTGDKALLASGREVVGPSEALEPLGL